jgi:hypothetical protein
MWGTNKLRISSRKQDIYSLSVPGEKGAHEEFNNDWEDNDDEGHIFPRWK